MKKIDFCEVIGDIDENYIQLAHAAKKPFWIKWGAAAACLALLTGTVFTRTPWFNGRTDIVTLSNGEQITFHQSDAPVGVLSLDLDVITIPLTEDENAALFPGLPATGNAIFQNSVPQDLIGFEGKIGNVKVVISDSDLQLLDTVIEGEDAASIVSGVPIVSGYFTTDPNSKGEQLTIYYASFTLDDCSVYLENAGTMAEREATKQELAEVIQGILENEVPDLRFLIGN